MTIKEMQLQLNLKFGSTLIIDGDNGKYTKSCIRMAKRVLGLPFNAHITEDFKAMLLINTMWLPESFEPIDNPYHLYEGETEGLYTWIKSKKPNTRLTKDDINEIDIVCSFWGFDTLHCLAHLIIESAWGISSKIRRNRNGFGIGVTDDPSGRYNLKYLTIPTSAYEWVSLLERSYLPRGQNTEQKLNISARRHKAEWFMLDSIAGFQNYATSQDKAMSCGLLVKDMKTILNRA